MMMEQMLALLLGRVRPYGEEGSRGLGEVVVEHFQKEMPAPQNRKCLLSAEEALLCPPNTLGKP